MAKLFRFSHSCFWSTLFGVSIVLVGWHEDINALKTGFVGPSTMKINTAIGLGLLATAGLLKFSKRKNSPWPLVGSLISTLVVVFAAVTLAQDLFHQNFRIDEFFKKDLGSLGTRWPPGRPSPVTAINFIFLGLALVGSTSSNFLFRKVAHGLTLTAWVLSFQSLVCYLEGVNATYGLALFTQIAVHTAFLFILICTGIILARPDEGVMKIISSSTEAGRIGKTLLFFAIFVPPTIAWVQMAGVKDGLWNDEVGSILRIVSQITFFSWVAFRIGASLLVSEARERETQEKLRQAVLIRDEFLSIASHELRTPLTSMKLQSQMMKRGLEKNDSALLTQPRINKMVELTDQGITRMSRLVEDMLDISRIQSGRLEVHRDNVKLASLVRETFEKFSLELTASKIEWRLDAPVEILVSIDRYRMEQVITNVITNAIRYAPNAPLEIRVVPLKTKVRLTFTDGGPGIAPENQERIFNRFERLVSVKQVSGLGLGLYIAREIVENHGGLMRVESVLGHGATFIIELPFLYKT